MNSVCLTGRLTKEPNLKYLPNNGYAVCEFDIAVNLNNSKGDSKKVNYFTIQCWKNLAEVTSSNLDKGRKVSIQGFLKNNHWKDENDKLHKDNLVVATRIEYLDFPKDKTKESLEFEPMNMDLVDGELPF